MPTPVSSAHSKKLYKTLVKVIPTSIKEHNPKGLLPKHFVVSGNKPDGDAARKLQESEGSSPFDLVVRTNMADDGPGSLKTAAGASYGVTLVTTAMALLSAAAVLA